MLTKLQHMYFILFLRDIWVRITSSQVPIWEWADLVLIFWLLHCWLKTYFCKYICLTKMKYVCYNLIQKGTYTAWATRFSLPIYFTQSLYSITVYSAFPSPFEDWNIIECSFNTSDFSTIKNLFHVAIFPILMQQRSWSDTIHVEKYIRNGGK